MFMPTTATVRTFVQALICSASVLMVTACCVYVELLGDGEEP